MTTSPPRDVIIAALRAASNSPCVKSKRGVAVYDVHTRMVRGTGFNSQPSKKCDTLCMENCNKLCVHAEHRALWAAKPPVGDLLPYEGVHVKIITAGGSYIDRDYDDALLEQLLVPSGGPSCWQCSRLILDSGLGGFWLFHEEGWKRYEPAEFHRLTLEACGLS